MKKYPDIFAIFYFLFFHERSFHEISQFEKKPKKIVNCRVTVSRVFFYFISGMTRHQRDDDLTYGRRTFEAHSLRPAFVPYHLYGQLASSKQGMEVLIKSPDIHNILAQLINVDPGDTDWLKTKAAIWSIANACISHEGINKKKSSKW